MPMTREAKQAAIDVLQEKMNRAKAALVIDFSGLTVAAVTDIRRAFRGAGVEYKVVKNTLLKRVIAGTPREGLKKVLVRTRGVAFKYDFEFGKLGKTAKDLAAKYDKFKVHGGFVENDVIAEPRALEVMASLPTLEEARAQLLGLINAPASKLLAQINAPGSHLVGVIQAKADKDKEASGTPAA